MPTKLKRWRQTSPLCCSEEVSIEFLKELLVENKVPFFTSIGGWWGTRNKKRESVEFDALAFNEKKVVIVSEAKWWNSLVDSDVLEKLVDKSKILNLDKDVIYFLFSKSGFTPSCIKKAKDMGSAKLVTYHDILRVFENG